MEKTKLGISVGLMGLAVVCVAYFGGYTPFLLFGGYIYLKEENEWLKKLVLQMFGVMIAFSAASLAISVIPYVCDVWEDFLNIFRLSLFDFIFNIVSRVRSFLSSMLTAVKVFVYAGLALKAVAVKEISVPYVDKFMNKYTQAAASDDKQNSKETEKKDA